MSDQSISGESVSNLLAFERWLKDIGKTAATGWRWRKRGWILTVNIAGRVYVSRHAIAEFERRAIAGEFAKEHIIPKRTPTKAGSASVNPNSA
jgi:hypothetical protein